MNPLIDPFLGPQDRIAYFTMEIALRPENPHLHRRARCAGGRHGPLLRRLELPIVFVTLASREGYLRQEIAPDG